MNSMLFQHMIQTRTFRTFSVISVILAGIVVGLETSTTIMSVYGSAIVVLDRLVLALFVAEISIRIAAFGSNPWRYFADPWNIFDFTVVTLCFLPAGGNFMAVLRLVRTLRLLRLLTVLPKLQMIVGALLRSIPSIGYVGLLLGLHFYIYAVLGVFLFGANDPVHFQSLGKSMLTLFQVLTLEGWADIMRIQIYGCSEYGYENLKEMCVASRQSPIAGSMFFVSFIIIGTMIILNLFIGVIMNGMQELAKEDDAEKFKSQTPVDAMAAIDHAIRDLNNLKVMIGLRKDR
jgi:voltage-gated sodium channel